MTTLRITVLAAALTGLAACQTYEALPAADSDDAAASGDVIGVRDGVMELHPGQALSIALPSNASTGFSWRVAAFDETVLTRGVPFGTEVADPHAPGVVGSGGQTEWRFQAARPGRVTLTFAYAQPWVQPGAKDTPPAETARYTVVVR